MKINEKELSGILVINQSNNDSGKLLTEQNPKLLLYDGKHYDLIHNNNQLYPDGFLDDIPFWLNMASCYGGAILTLFCGAGRVAIPLAEEGYQVTGIDISESMLKEAKRRSAQVKWIQADASSFELGQKFSLVIIPLNSIAHLLELEALESCLKCIRDHLEPGGKVVIDFENTCSQENIDFFFSKVRHLYSIYPDPDGRGTMVVTCERELDLFEQTCKAKFFFKLLEQKEESCEEATLRFYSAKEFETLLKYNGFVVEHRFGDCDQTPFTPQSPRHILVCFPQK